MFLVFCLFGIVPPMCHTHPHLNTTILIKKRDISLSSFKQSNAHSNVGKDWTVNVSILPNDRVLLEQ